MEDDLNHLITSLTGGDQSLIYYGSPENIGYYAQSLGDKIPAPESQNTELHELAKYIRKSLHKLYGLADLGEKGIAFHFGGLPQEIRNRIEHQFKIGNIKYLFTTSTLLQGVNLPAKNIFLLTNKLGRKIMSSLEFNNLIGRAGRHSKELYGNVFIV